MIPKRAPDVLPSPTSSPPPPPSTPVCDRLRGAGAWNTAWEPFYQLDPEWTERFMSMATKPMLSGVLDPKTIEFLAIAVDASCTHLYAPGVRRHIAKALDLGATLEEITAVLQLTSVLGIHSMSVGAPLLLEEMARRQTSTAAAADPLPSTAG
jgi:alkylhydroperoxidase/carboxymuconolactone decarboxylase family protein YurZ